MADELDMPDPKPLSQKQTQALALLAFGHTNVEVASKIKVHRQRISEWRADPVFRNAEEQFKSELLARTQDRLSNLVAQAAVIVGQIILDESASIRDRLNAARTALQFGLPRMQMPVRSSESLEADLDLLRAMRAKTLC